MRGLPTRVLAIAALLVSLALAGVVSHYASSEPDGLTRVAADHGLAERADRSPAEDGPLAGYQVKGMDDPPLSRGVAGVVGALVVLVAAGALTYGVRRRPGPHDETADTR